MSSVDGRTKRLLVDALQAGPFVLVSDARHEILGTSEIEPWSVEKCVEFQDSLRAFFRSLIREEPGGLVPTLQIERFEFGVAPTGTAHVVVTIDGTAANVLRFQLVQLILAAGLERLRKCECGRVFARTGRREFCSPRCQKRVYMRAKRKLERDGERRRHGKKTRKG